MARNMQLLRDARDEAKRDGDEVKAAALNGLVLLFSKEMIRCLDPRHSTTPAQADEAVADSLELSDVCKILRERSSG